MEGDLSLRPGRALMVQGTTSDAGKSLLVTGLCRLFRREGWRVLPFKAQNMANNAAVTSDGGEIGRAQALQALAAGVEPAVAMNPLLLKPEGATRSQRILLGRPAGHRDARDWRRPQPDAIEAIRRSLAQLRNDADLVLIEGAGSPAELNLLAGDLANMHTARLADAPVLLAADIERGGVFASLYGTIALLPAVDRARVAGLIVNRFRGDQALFADGKALLEHHCRRSVLGVVPYLDELALPIEDGQGIDRLAAIDRADPDAVEVAVVLYPRAANLDDLLPLFVDRRFRVRFARGPVALHGTRLIVLPGSKATTADLAWLRERELDQAIVAAHDAGAWILGICGGCQMLGRRIDHRGLEAGPSPYDGLGFLPFDTTFSAQKTVRRVQGRGAAQGPFAGCVLAGGYEIHHGRIEPAHAAPLWRLGASGEPEGAWSGSVLGTLVHGCFESDEVRDRLAARLGAGGRSGLSYARHLEQQIDRWADHLAIHLDLARIRRIAGLSS